MGIVKIIFDDWNRERKIKKHQKEVAALLKKNQATRVTTTAQAYGHPEKADPPFGIYQQDKDREKAPANMDDYVKSGELDQDLESMQHMQELNQAVAAIKKVCQTENSLKGGLTIECTHNGQDILISVLDDTYIVGKWRYQIPTGGQQLIRLYHLNYYHNQAPGPNYHFQQQASQLYSAEDVAVYILRHDKRKVQSDRKNRQKGVYERTEDDLIEE